MCICDLDGKGGIKLKKTKKKNLKRGYFVKFIGGKINYLNKPIKVNVFV